MASSSASPVILIAASLVLGAGAGYLGGQLAAPAASVASAAGDPLAQERLDERLGRIERDLSGLDDRLETLALRPTPAPAEPVPVQPLAQLDSASMSRLQRLLEAPENAAAMLDDGGALISTVDAALKRIREEEEAARDKARDERRAEELDARLEELRTELALDNYQVDEMRTLFTEGGKAMTELWDAMRDGGTGFTDMREKMTALREANDKRLSEILSPSQLEGYEAAGGMGFGGRRGGFGGGPRGPGGR